MVSVSEAAPHLWAWALRALVVSEGALGAEQVTGGGGGTGTSGGRLEAGCDLALGPIALTLILMWEVQSQSRGR